MLILILTNDLYLQKVVLAFKKAQMVKITPSQVPPPDKKLGKP